MNRTHLMSLLTLCLFCIYILDVVSGALWDSEFLSDVASAILLVLTSICFTAVILGFEKSEKEKNNPPEHS
ncbi:MAG: hypothetical protein ACI9XK_004053 [Granulosicoccus sp.]|jgi:hypothetical protein